MADLAADKTIALDQIITMDDAERIIWEPLTMIQPKEGEKEELYQKSLFASKDLKIT